jgi:hypothetical protein
MEKSRTEAGIGVSLSQTLGDQKVTVHLEHFVLQAGLKATLRGKCAIDRSLRWFPPLRIGLGKSQHGFMQIGHEEGIMYCLGHAVELASLAGGGGERCSSISCTSAYSSRGKITPIGFPVASVINCRFSVVMGVPLAVFC